MSNDPNWFATARFWYGKPYLVRLYLSYRPLRGTFKKSRREAWALARECARP